MQKKPKNVHQTCGIYTNETNSPNFKKIDIIKMEWMRRFRKRVWVALHHTPVRERKKLKKREENLTRMTGNRLYTGSEFQRIQAENYWKFLKAFLLFLCITTFGLFISLFVIFPRENNRTLCPMQNVHIQKHNMLYAVCWWHFNTIAMCEKYLQTISIKI